MDAPIQGFLAATRIKGIGRVRWHKRHLMGTSTSIETMAYYIPSAGIRLFSRKNIQIRKNGQIDRYECSIFTLPNQLSLHLKFQRLPIMPPPTGPYAWLFLPLQAKIF